MCKVVESLIIALLVIVILLLLLVIFIPAYLERLSRRNQEQLNRQAAELNTLQRDLRRVERRLAGFARTRSAAYRQGVAAIGEPTAALSARIPAITTALSQVSCPDVFDYLFPAQHFILRPEHIGIVLADARRLKQTRAALVEANDVLGQARALLDGLAGLPERLAGERAVLAQRLVAVTAAVNGERRQGIEALDDLTRDSEAARRSLSQWEQAISPDAPLATLDEGALVLEQAAAQLSELEARVGDLAQEREALDERLRRATTELDNAQAVYKSGPEAAVAPPQTRPLLLRAAALLNESAPAHRRRREFAAAGADVAAATRLIALARDLTVADQQARLLDERDDGVSLSEAIGGLRRELTELFDRLGNDTVDGASALADAGLAGRAARLRTRAENLSRRQDEIIAGLEQEAAATRERLDRVWDAGQHLLRLADDDPFARRRTRLLTEYEAARHSPAALEQFRSGVAEFESSWDQWVTRVQGTRALIGRLRGGLPQLIDEAKATADPWLCLAGTVIAIQQRTADFETTQAHFGAAHHRREAESLMAQLDAIEQDIQSRLAELNDRAARLNYLEADVRQLIDLAAENQGELAPDHPDRPKWDRAMRVIDHHVRAAHAAQHYEDASVALLRAADAANNIAL